MRHYFFDHDVLYSHASANPYLSVMQSRDSQYDLISFSKYSFDQICKMSFSRSTTAGTSPFGGTNTTAASPFGVQNTSTAFGNYSGEL